MAKKIKKTVIISGYECNNRCKFCCNAHKDSFPKWSTKDIISKVVEAKKRETTYLEIIGGEQTIRPDIIDIISFAKRLKFKVIAMATNGRMFSYEDFAKKIISAGLNHIIFSIHGHNAELHDSLTQVKGSFGQLIKGIRNVRKLGFSNIASNTTLVKQNYKFAFNIGKFIYGLKIRNAEFIFVDPTRGAPFEHFHEFVPLISEAAPYIRRCLKIGKRYRVKHWHVRYVPLCYFSGCEDQVSELSEEKTFQTEHLAPDFRNFNVGDSRKKIGRIKPDKCNGCKKYNICEGIWKEYYNQYGDRELKPKKRF